MLNIKNDYLVQLHYNNETMIQLAENPVFHPWTKHIKVHYHFIRENILKIDINLLLLNIEKQKLDID